MLFDTTCNDPCNKYSYVFENNFVRGVAYWNYDEDQAPGIFYGAIPATQHHNDFFRARHSSALGFNDRCPFDRLFLVEPPHELYSRADFDTMNFAVSAGSPAVGTGVLLPGYPRDFTGAPRANPPSRDALEYGSSFNIASYLAVLHLPPPFYFEMIFADNVLQPNPAVNPPIGQNPPLASGPVTSLYPLSYLHFTLRFY